ncbi:hypothetical protein [uncultured Maribacter sp.]|uniref:hypothetical protein n=1 Tax=uncultured Maribacter sp. TaxID=431308 RepID=UPI00261816E2|nr:hypothetical protein [uncultured Maribacter sp.]
MTPALNNIGLNKWDGKYTWYNDFNESGIKHVVRYQVFKGFNGSFAYGNCFSFIPTTSNNGKKLINHKTDKSTTLHLWERLDGWKESFEGTQRENPYDKISHWNEKDFRKTLDLVIKKYPKRLENWFDEHNNIEQSILTVKKQIDLGGSYDFNSPSQQYLLAFLYAYKGDIDTAYNYIQNYYNPIIDRNADYKYEKELVIDRIRKISC